MQDKQAEKSFFDQFVSENTYDVFDARGYTRLLKELSVLVKPSAGETFLDIGCGTGAFTQHLLQMQLEGVGVDISYKSVQVASCALPQATFVVSDTETLPFRENQFDIVTFSGVLHHLPSMDRALNEGLRVLKRGGRLFAYDPNRYNPAMWLYRSPNSPFSSREGLTVNEQLLSRADIQNSLKKAGFVDVRSVGVSGITYKYVASFFARKLLALYNFGDVILDKTGLARHIGSFLISYARKREG